MNQLYKYAQHFIKLELMKVRLEVFQNEMERSGIRPDLKNQLFPGQSGREGVDFIVKSNSGKYHEIYLQPINLEKDRSVKISKSVLYERNGASFVFNFFQTTRSTRRLYFY